MGEAADRIARHYAEVAQNAARATSMNTDAPSSNEACTTGRSAENAPETTCASGAVPSTDAVATACPCCDPASGSEAFSLYADEVLAGLPAGALAASRGCGDPVARAQLQPGERVLDLGSGGGIDALIAARLVGSTGQVHGLDMMPQMVELARRNAAEAGINNVAFLEGSIECVPLPDASVDVVVSNCVINLCENKAAALAEARRVLVPGGRLVVSDIVAFGPIPPEAYDDLCAITGCRNGISDADDYRRMLEGCGFDRITLEPKTTYTLDVLQEKAQRKGHVPQFEHAASFPVDAVTGSAIVYAYAGEQS